MPTLWLAAGNALVELRRNGSEWKGTAHLEGHTVRCVAVDREDVSKVVSGTIGSGAWFSLDGGQNWQRAAGIPEEARVLAAAITPPGSVEGGDRSIYFGTEPSAVYRAELDTLLWKPCEGLTDLPSADEWSFPPRPETHHVRWIEPVVHAPGVLFVAIEAGALVMSPDHGETWYDRVPGGPIDTHELAAHRGAPGRLYSAAGDGFFESLDAGRTWQHREEGLEHHYIWSVAVDPGDPFTIVISAATGPRQAHDRDRAESFLYRRTADGPWQRLSEGLPDGQGRRAAVLATDHQTPGTFYAAWEGEIFQSTDHGVTWQSLPLQWPDGYHVDRPRSLVAIAR